MNKVIIYSYILVASYAAALLNNNIHSIQRKFHTDLNVFGSKEPLIALTREEGTNESLRKLLSGLNCIELPCIAFGPGEDIDKLSEAIMKNDIICITSPQAAQVFLSSWISINKPSNIKIASVGKGTSKPLIEAGITPVFEPSQSTAETLALELPLSLGNTILYPSSSLAETTLQKGLTERGFIVTRLNTYETVPSVWTEEQLNKAKEEVEIVTFASPSAIRIWRERCGVNQV